MSVRRNKLRSGLTALGVTVGVFALTTIIALGGGLEQAIIEQLTDDESQTRIVVRPGFGKQADRKVVVEGVDDPVKVDRLKKAMAKRRRGGPAQMRRKQLTPATLKEMAALEHVASVRPLAIDRFKLALGEHELDGALSFGIPTGSKRWKARVIAGKPFSDGARGVYLHEYLLYRWGYRNDAEQAALVGTLVTLSRPRAMAGIGALLSAAQAYGGVDVQVDPKKVEQMARMFGIGAGGKPNKDGEKVPDLAVQVPILGVIRERIEADGFEVWEDSFSMQSDVFLPQAFAEELFLQVPSNVSRGYNAAAIEVDGPVHVKPVEDHLREEGYRTVSIGTILERLGQAMAMITAVVSGLTAIALVVALLGIVNTMVMNVSERTREIGVLKAVGATDRQVRSLFLVESALIGLAGGLSGVALALLSSIPGNYFTRKAILEVSHYHYDGSIFHFPAWLIGLAMLFAVGLSVLAALGPATRASRTDPVTALRDE